MSGVEIIPPLDFESAMVLFQAVLAPLGMAFIFRLTMRYLLNK